MIIFKNELPMDHENSILHIVEDWALNIYHDDRYSDANNNMDYCRESAWFSVEDHLNNEGVEMEDILYEQVQ